ncbi:MAG: DUF2878 domain-containing protein, partial [Planctomycetota bacterium]
CVIGAAQRHPMIGPAVVSAILVIHSWSLRSPSRQLRPILVGAVVGTMIESTWITIGVYFPAGDMRGSPLCPLWLTALWLNFAMFAQAFFSFTSLRPSVAAIIGAMATPFSYVAAASLGAIVVVWSPTPALLAWATAGAVGLPATQALMIRGTRLARSSPDGVAADDAAPPIANRKENISHE